MAAPIGNYDLANDSISITTTSNDISITGSPVVLGGSLTINTTQSSNASNYTGVIFSASPYTVLTTDYYISVDTSGGAISLLFPDSPMANQVWVVKDRTGHASSNNITITTVSGTDTFDFSGTSYTISSNFGYIQLLFHGANYELF
jgi:hypothetical protein